MKTAIKSKTHTIRRPKVEHKKEHEVHKAAHTEPKHERYETPKKTEVHHILPEPEFRGFRGILPQRL